MKKEKIIFISIIVGIIIFIVAIGLISSSKSNNDYLKEITYEEYQEKVNQEENFILYIKRDNCPYCEQFTPTLKKVANDNKVTVYFINLTHIGKDKTDLLEDELSFSGTPVVMFFENGKELGTYARIIGNKEKDLVIEKLQLRGYIK